MFDSMEWCLSLTPAVGMRIEELSVVCLCILMFAFSPLLNFSLAAQITARTQSPSRFGSPLLHTEIVWSASVWLCTLLVIEQF